jgi:hypothetical protein
VFLEETETGWRLTPDDDTRTETPGADVIPFPLLPLYSGLKVACGAFAESDPLAEASDWTRVESERKLDTKRHFLVRAEGDSMDGGLHPIKDGDLVLCEWWPGGSVDDIEGKPFLLVGHDGSEKTLAAMKVPKRRGRGWILEGFNPAFEPIALESGVRVEPVAAVLETVTEAEGLTLWASYDRDAIAAAFGGVNNPSWKVGHRDVTVEGNEHTVLMVTLRKGHTMPLQHHYADRFLSPREFQWESQNSTSPESKKGRSIIQHLKQERQIHLFVKYRSKDDFTYCGTMNCQRHEGSKPMTVWCELNRPLPDALWELWGV